MGIRELFQSLLEGTNKVETTSPKPFVLENWIEERKMNYGGREDGLSKKIKYDADCYDPDRLGLSGQFLTLLMSTEPWMSIQKFWGGPKGIKAEKRLYRWKKLIERQGNEMIVGDPYLLRFSVDATKWVPHPYIPPLWTIVSYENFSSYVVESKEAFELCYEWRKENSIATERIIKQKLNSLTILFGASFRLEKSDYVDVALCIPHDHSELLDAKLVWKNEAELASLIVSYFSDTIREYSPAWLGDQRIDVYVPSINVAFEYQGEQHYKPVDLFGGVESFKQTQERDRRKKNLCQKNGIRLIEWKYTESIGDKNLELKLKKIGAELPIKNDKTENG